MFVNLYKINYFVHKPVYGYFLFFNNINANSSASYTDNEALISSTLGLRFFGGFAAF